MKKIRKLLLLIGLLFSLQSFSQNYLPICEGELIEHHFYSLSYNEQHEQANWVYYILTSENIHAGAKRTDDFRSDPEVSTGSAQLLDYKGKGYDRGHLAPAGDMTHSVQAMSESFFLSNMSPQEASFNRGRWKTLESLVRNWGMDMELVHVATGPIFMDNKGTIGSNNVTVPGYYYKVIYAPEQHQMIGFIMPNEKLAEDVVNYAVSVDRVEGETGIDFFSQLNDSLEASLESTVNHSFWNFNPVTTQKNAVTTTIPSSSVQCKGTAKSTGLRCKSKTKNANGYCTSHQSQCIEDVVPKATITGSTQCMATTKSGARCKRKSTEGGQYCWQHE